MISLTNGVQIPENAVQLQTTAAIDGYYVTQPLRLVQYDETLPVAAVQLTYQNQPYAPPTGAELNVRMGKPDGKGVYNPCLGVDSNGVVYFAFTLQMTIVAGTGTLTVEITDSGVKNSAPIIAEIRPNPVPEGSIESADEFLTLQEILAEAEKWGQIVQANASNIQQVVDNLEDIQNAAENAQAAAASAAAAQRAAQEALGFRKFYSAVVPDTNGNLDPSRPMTVGPAASAEIESTGDRIQSVTALGFTRQAGTGDPSPTNVRAITNGGIVLHKTVFNGSENWALGGDGIGETPYFYLNDAYSGDLVSSSLYSERYPGVSIFTTNSVQGIGGYKTTCYIRDSKYATVADFKTALRATPLTVWYATTDGTGTLYIPIILQGGEYRATCLELTAPLCEGDGVVSWVKSGCDKVVTFDGSEDEDWETYQKYFVIWGVFENSVQMSPSDKNENIYTNILYQQLPDSSGQHAVGTFYAVNTTGSGNFLVVNLNGDTDISAFRAALAARPLTVWYRSANYTEADDIAVSLETHQRAVLVLDGTEGWATAVAGAYYMFPSNLPKAFAATSATSAVSDYLTAEPTNDIAAGTEGFGIGPSGSIAVRLPNGAAPSAYMPNKPLTVVYQLANPITYAHPAAVLEAATGDQLTYTVTGQSGGQVSVALKPFQDGGHAKTADNATNAQNADNATNAQNADNATQFDGHAWSEVPGQAPVQSVNSKTGAVMLTAADVGAATNAQGQKADSALIFMGFLPNGTAVNSIQNGIWDGDASHRPNPAPDGLNEDLTIVKAGRYLQATDVFGNAKRWNFYSSVWSDPV